MDRHRWIMCLLVPLAVASTMVIEADGSRAASPVTLSAFDQPELSVPLRLPPDPFADEPSAGDAADQPYVMDAEEIGAGTIIDFPEERPPFIYELIEAAPRALTWPDKPLAGFFSRVLFAEHVEIESALEEEATGLQPIPERPRLLVEWNERFLSPGWLNRGIKMPTGVIWRPAVWVFGQYRSAYQYFDTNRAPDPISEWANTLDLFGQVNLSGTERVLVGLRPMDEERGDRREFAGYDFRNGNWIDGGNAEFQTLFFEGDFGEIFPFLDPYDTRFLDYGFSVGRMPLIAQQGLLLNEDRADSVTVTRNTLNGYGNLNLRITGVYSWDELNRNSPTGRPNTFDEGSQMFAILTESDYYHNTFNVDAVYVDSDDRVFGDLFSFGVSAIRRHYLFHNTYNTSLHFLASIPNGPTTPFSNQGELLFAQTSWTPHHTEDLIYVNAFWAIDQFTSPARGPLVGGPLGQTGILFAAPGLGRAGPPINNGTNDVAGASLGYQLFFDETRQQVIWEIGGRKETEGVSRGIIATGMRYQRAMGQHFIFIVDGFVGKQEAMPTSTGARSEILLRF